MYIDELKLYQGGDYILPNGIHIITPTLKQICDYGEKEYLKIVSMFTATTIDRCSQLDDMGIDYTAITNLEMFSLFSPFLQTEDTRLLFGDLDFTKFVKIFQDGNVVLKNQDGIEITENDFSLIAAYIRKMNGIPAPLYTKVTNEFSKKQMIIDARNDADFHKKLTAIRGEHSEYLPLVSALVNHPYFKYGWKDVWDIKVYAFFDSLKRVSIIENANHLYTGLYSGCIEYKKVKKELDWLKPVE